MKLKFNILLSLLLISIATAYAGKGEYTRTVHQAYTRGSVSALNVLNKYGSITIADAGGDSVTIDVTITVENAYESKANYLMKQIDIDIHKSGQTIYAETQISPNFKTKQDFRINYTINIPASCNLDVTNKYGNVSVSSLEAKGKFTIAYGNITAGELDNPEGHPIQLVLSYGKADMGNINQLDAEVKYSKLYLEKVGHLHLESKYSTLSADKIDELNASSKYDGFSIDRAGSITSDSKYTHYSIDLLEKKIILNTEYGNVDIDKVDAGFTTIDITNAYGGIKIGLDDHSYQLEGDCSYCNLSYPQDRFVGNHQKDNQELRVSGKVGNGTAMVRIVSRYGSAKLF